MKNLLPNGVQENITGAFRLLDQAVRLLTTIAQNTSPRAPTSRQKTFRLELSNAQTTRELPFPRNIIVGILVGADHSGRGQINFGADSVGVYLLGNQTILYNFGSQFGLEFGGRLAVSFTPPANTSSWDITMMIEPGGPPGE
jgi:hypothetical protein